jgi:hypothetical protein
MHAQRSSLFSLLFLTFGLAAITLAGCDAAGPGDGEDPLTGGQVSVQLTSSGGAGGAAQMQAASSSATDIAEAFVTISGVELVGEEGRYTLSDEEQEIDLLALEDGVPVDLAFDEVPTGEYDQLRLAVTDTRLVLTDGSEPSLKVPSGKIKLLLPNFEIEDDGDDAEILVEFDTDRSFVQAGRSGKYIFRPVVRTRSVEVNDEELGEEVEVTGRITALDPGATVEVEGLPFEITGRTEVGDDDEDAPDLEVGQFVELEAGLDDGGAYVAQEIEVEEQQESATLEAPLDEVRDDALVLLGVPFAVDAGTHFDGFTTLADLEGAGRVEVEFAYDDGADTYRLIEIEAESSEEDEGEDEDGDDDRGDDDERGENEEAAEVEGRITSRAQNGAIAVEGLTFAVTGRTEVEGGRNVRSLQEGQFVKLEATYAVDGTLVATEIEVEDEEEAASLEAPVEEVSGNTITLLETSFTADADTELDGLVDLSGLERGDEVEVEFTYDSSTGSHRLLKVEAESSERDDGDE